MAHRGVESPDRADAVVAVIYFNAPVPCSENERDV